MNELQPPYLERCFRAFLQGEDSFWQVKKFVEVEPDQLEAEKIAKSIARAFLDRLLER